MNYYRRYVGDYLRDTARLSMLEHGAYNLMLDYYYADERPLPLDRQELYLMVRAMRPEDRKAVDKVLGLFFTQEPDGYHQKRVDHEIGVSKTARANGKSGGRPLTGIETGLQTGSITGSVTEHGGGLGHPPTTNLQPPTSNHQKHSSGASPPDYPPGFVRFWTAWPRTERKQGKPKCLAIWKRKGLEKKTDAIVAHVERMAKSASWKTGYDPMPTTYLNEERWDGADLNAPDTGTPDYSEVIANLKD